jgi:phosphatidylglycerol:prolipoprotein diacylglycerol transferase
VWKNASRVTIPYYELPALRLPFDQKIDIFGVVSAIAVFLGAWIAAKEARNYAKVSDQPLRDVVPWAVGFGLIGGHFMHLFAYHPELLTEAAKISAWTVVKVILSVWDGLSSMGGVLGALLGIFIYFRKEKIPLTPYLDPLALGTSVGWSLGRFGCFLVHDHPGVKTDFFLAVEFPGGPRHDLGLYDMFVLMAIAGVLYTVKRTRPPAGTLMGLLAVLYTVPRFFLDFLRASDLSFVDRRYAGLTPGQYTVVGIFAVGVWLIARARRTSLTPSK